MIVHRNWQHLCRLQADIFSSAAGADYRREILRPGGSRDAMDSLVAFLGRAPSSDPFLRSKGLAAAAA